MEGELHPTFTPVADTLRRLLRSYAGGAAVCVWYEGECVVDLWGGVRDESRRRWEHDTLAPSFSTTKGVASTLVHVMVDRGLLDYDERVAKYWPEFARNGKESITLRQVLSHQSGLYHVRQMIDHAEEMLDWNGMVRAIERAAPIHPPGKRTGYHGLTYGYLVGEILQRVTGRPFPELVQQELARPLGLRGLYVGAPPEAIARAAELMRTRLGFLSGALRVPEAVALARLRRTWFAVLQRMFSTVGISLDFESLLDALAPRGITSFDFGSERVLRACIPAANGLFDARSLAKLYAVLAHGGELGGVRLLSRQTLNRATQRQSPTPSRVVIPFDMRWRLGWHGVFTTRGIPPRAFGHFGFGGSGAWADPSRRLAVALVVNGGVGTPFGDLRIARIGGAVLASLARRPRSARRRLAAQAR